MFNWIRTKVLGVDLQQVQRDMDESDRRLAEINAAHAASGHYTPEVWAQAEANRLASIINASEQVNQAFLEGAADGAQNIRHGIGGAINATVGNVLRVVPWQVWIIGAVAVIIYFWPVLRTRFSK